MMMLRLGLCQKKTSGVRLETEMDYEVKMKKRTETGGVKHNLYVRLCPYRINSDHDEARKSMKKNNEKN